MDTRELAESLDIGSTYVIELETGVTPPPREKANLALAKVPGADPRDLSVLAKRVPSHWLR